MAPDIQDDGFHEIQLNGKQLVFLFMAATVVSVVIFLCGVLVGRGVRVDRASLIDVSSVTAAAETTPQPQASSPAPPPAGSDPTTAAAPAPAQEDLSYFQRLEKQNPPADQLKAKPSAAAPLPTAEPAPKAKPAEKPTVATSSPGSTGSAASPATSATAVPATPKSDANTLDSGGQGFAVQIAALNVRSEAEAIAKRLTSKGYSAYVMAPPDGTPSVFRVRVGKFPTRREAETVAAKLQKEEQFKPWVTR